MEKTILAICAAIVILSAGIACHAEELSLTYPEAYCSSGPEFKACVKKYATLLARRNADPEEVGWSRLHLGMTDADVLRVWVAPDHINTTVTVYGKGEQWVYGRNYLYFENGHLVAFQRNAR